MRRAAVVLALTVGGCAGWVEADDPWFDAEDPELSPALVYGYAAPPEEPPVLEEDELPVRDDEPTPVSRTASFTHRGPGHRCTLTMRVAEVRPRLEPAAIRRTVQRHENDIRVCYNHALRRDPTAAGRVAMQFLIAADGTVPAAAVENSAIDDPRLLACLSATIRRWSFPVPPGSAPAVVHYPYVFSSARPRTARQGQTPRVQATWHPS